MEKHQTALHRGPGAFVGDDMMVVAPIARDRTSNPG